MASQQRRVHAGSQNRGLGRSAGGGSIAGGGPERVAGGERGGEDGGESLAARARRRRVHSARAACSRGDEGGGEGGSHGIHARETASVEGSTSLPVGDESHLEKAAAMRAAEGWSVRLAREVRGALESLSLPRLLRWFASRDHEGRDGGRRCGKRGGYLLGSRLGSRSSRLGARSRCDALEVGVKRECASMARASGERWMMSEVSIMAG